MLPLDWIAERSYHLCSTYCDVTDDIEAPSKNFIFLTAAMQKDMSSEFPLIRVLPWNHFGRKNVGYLYAILHGATTIWDFDDDNILLTNDNIFEIFPVAKSVNGSSVPTSVTVREAEGYSSLSQLSFNPYPLMDCPSTPCKSIYSDSCVFVTAHEETEKTVTAFCFNSISFSVLILFIYDLQAGLEGCHCQISSSITPRWCSRRLRSQ